MNGVSPRLASGLKTVCIAVFLAASLSNCPAPHVRLTPVADTTLSENYPNHNFGAMSFANSGTTQNYTRNRALFQFDLAGALPAGARITSASLILEVVGQTSEQPASGRFNLHRVLQPWGEGNKQNSPGGGAGQGSPATINEATWNDRYAFTTNVWTLPGAAPTNDFVTQISSGVTVFGVDQSPYTIPSTPEMVADLQLWLDETQTNFGWLLLCAQEATAFTARRFGTREDPFNAPRLELDFEIVPVIDSASKTGNEFALSFLAQADRLYTVEFCDNPRTNAWRPLAYVWTPNEAKHFTVTATADAPWRFYRLVTTP